MTTPPQSEYREIQLTLGKVAFVSSHRFEFLNQWKWTAAKSKNYDLWYAIRMSSRRDGKRHAIRMHREILGLALGDPREGDHEDGNGLNNQDWNLRIVDDLEQQWNKAIYACNKTGFKGVRFTRNAYEANINRDGKTVYLGRRKTPEEAFELYKTAALNLHGQYARFN